MAQFSREEWMTFDRRRFFQLFGAASVGYGLRSGYGESPSPQQTQTHPKAQSSGEHKRRTINRRNVVAIQVKPFAWIDEGVDQLRVFGWMPWGDRLEVKNLYPHRAL